MLPQKQISVDVYAKKKTKDKYRNMNYLAWTIL